MNNEKILRIEEASFKNKKDDYRSFNGFEVVTDKQTIRLGIDDSQSCCERPGYFWSNDNPQDFIGAIVRDISITDTSLNEAKMKENDIDGEYFEGGVMFVNIDTDRGMLQFVAYNAQNGYYGHHAIVMSEQCTHEEVI